MREVLREAEDANGMDVAVQVLDVLMACYPSYSWHVREIDGALVIKEQALTAMFGQYGMMLKSHESYSWSDLKREVILAAGEFLERANLPRGKWTGQEAELEGADPRFRRPS